MEAQPSSGSAGDAVPLLRWSEALDTGFADIDGEHRQLLGLLNGLAHARHTGAGAAELGALCTRLHRYAHEHFQHEEALMAAWPIDAARKAVHQRAHRAFSERIERAGALIGTDPQAVVDHLLSFLVNWLLHHISGVDARMAAEVRALEDGTPRIADSRSVLNDALVDTVSELYDSLGKRSLDLVAANAALNQEVLRRQASEAALRQSEARFSHLYQFAPVALWEFDWSGARAALQGAARTAAGPLEAHLRAHPQLLQEVAAGLRVCDVNDAAVRQVGVDARERLLGAQALAVIEPGLPTLATALAALAAGAGASSGEMLLRRADGAQRELAFNIVAMPEADRDGRDIAIVATLDITESKQVLQDLQVMSRHDALTGLANRVLLAEQTQQALVAARRDRHRVAVLFIDLDGFKPVNDRHGHAVGDALLVEVASRLRGCVRAADTVARLGGDEFVVLLAGLGEAHQALALAEKIRAALAQPCLLAGRTLHVTASIGLALYPEHGHSPEQLFEHADEAMYVAKQEGSDRVRLCSGPDTGAG